MRTRNKVFLFFLGILILIIGIFTFVTEKGKRQLNQPSAYMENLSEEMPEYQHKNVAGKNYQYKDGLINILCLGIDGRGKKEENNDYGFGQKADCIYLATFDTKKNTLTFLNISRDTIVPIRWFDSMGKEAGFYDRQINLQYTMGNGLETSCELMEETVSRLLGGIPIQGYCALYWSGVEVLQEKIGPVALEVPEELHELDLIHFLESGETVLTPEQAKIFVQGRDTTVTGSNELRMYRQQMYVKALYQKTYRTIRHRPWTIFHLWELVNDYLVTDLSREEVLSLGVQFGSKTKTASTFETVPGVSVDTDTQDVFIIDEKGMEELLLRIFYEEY